MAKTPRPRPLRPKDTFNEFWVMINVSGPRYWKVSANSIEKTTAPASHEGPVISFDENADFRVAMKKGSNAQAIKHFLQEKQEKCCSFPGSKYDLGTGSYTPYYATPIGRVMSFEHKIFPGTYFIDSLLAARKVKLEQDKVVGFQIEVDDEDSFKIVVLYGLRTTGELLEPNISLNPPELDLVIRDYAQTHQIDDFEPLLFNIEDICTNPVGIGYPTEKMVGALPARVLLNSVAAGLMVAALGSYAYSGYIFLGNKALASQVKKNAAAEKQAKEQVTTVVSTNLQALARANSVDYKAGFQYSQILYHPILTIDNLVLSREKGTIFTTMNFFSGDTTGSGQGQLNDYTDINSVLNSPLPEGLTRGKVIMGADGNAYKVEFEFQPLNSNLGDVVGVK